MTTILKAAQELERREATGKQPAAAWVDPGSGTRWRWIGIVLLALVCSIGGFVLRNTGDRSSTPISAPEAPKVAPQEAIRIPPAEQQVAIARQDSTREPAPERHVVPQEPPREPAAERHVVPQEPPRMPAPERHVAPEDPVRMSVPAAQVAPQEPSPPLIAERSLAEAAQENAPPETAPRVTEEEAPWARVEKPLPAAPAMARGSTRATTRAPRTAVSAPRAAESLPLAAPEEAERRHDEPVPRVAAERLKHRESEPPPRADDDPEASGAKPQVSSRTSEPRVQVKSIAYSTNVADRIVTLRIDGGPAVRLRQGDSAGGLEVHLIHPRGVYLRHGGTVFAVDIAH